MTFETSDRPSLDEAYAIATNTSDLTLHPDRTCSATHLIAAGLLGNRMGSALVHLRGDWDGLGKLRKATEAEIVARAKELPKVKGKLDVKRARGEKDAAHRAAMRHRAHSLPGWVPALSIMVEWAVARRVDLDLLSPALYHWLVPTCAVCEGRGQIKMEDAPVLGKQCHACNGLRLTIRSSQADRVDSWLRGCVGKAKRERGGLMRGEGEVAPMADRLRVVSTEEEMTQEEAQRVAAAFADSMGKRR